mmetsp:Transcript_49474/g.117739  ORF Transcript_49474/g.117739 Transcript_49474/m.117739 type:complete len:315 (-) Transcript_49474:235-1179(-)
MPQKLAPAVGWREMSSGHSAASNHSSSDGTWVEIRDGHWVHDRLDACHQEQSSSSGEASGARSRFGAGKLPSSHALPQDQARASTPSGQPSNPAVRPSRDAGGSAGSSRPVVSLQEASLPQDLAHKAKVGDAPLGHLAHQGQSKGQGTQTLDDQDLEEGEHSDTDEDSADDVDLAIAAGEEPPSIGSAFHTSGSCRPCIHFRAGGSCVAGAQCRYCHFHHSVRQFKAKNKTRPCKGKRDRYRKFSARVMDMIYMDPWSFNIDGLELPVSIRSNPILKRKFEARMMAHLELAKSGHAHPGNVDAEEELLFSTTSL